MEKSLKDLIERLPIPGLKESADRHIIAEAITTILSIPIAPKKVAFKDGIITLAVPPVVKSAILINQQCIRESLAEKGIEIQQFR
jgi:hypothetical protein